MTFPARLSDLARAEVVKDKIKAAWRCKTVTMPEGYGLTTYLTRNGSSISASLHIHMVERGGFERLGSYVPIPEPVFLAARRWLREMNAPLIYVVADDSTVMWRKIVDFREASLNPDGEGWRFVRDDFRFLQGT